MPQVFQGFSSVPPEKYLDVTSNQVTTTPTIFSIHYPLILPFRGLDLEELALCACSVILVEGRIINTNLCCYSSGNKIREKIIKFIKMPTNSSEKNFAC
jgi:hypothetical protein